MSTHLDLNSGLSFTQATFYFLLARSKLRSNYSPNHFNQEIALLRGELCWTAAVEFRFHQDANLIRGEPRSLSSSANPFGADNLGKQLSTRYPIKVRDQLDKMGKKKQAFIRSAVEVALQDPDIRAQVEKRAKQEGA